MLLTLTSFRDLERCLSDIYEDADKSIFENTIRISTCIEAKSEVADEWTMHVSAVVQSSGGEYLLQFNEILGVDYPSDPNECEGSTKDELYRTTIKRRFPDWRILPGIIGQ